MKFSKEIKGKKVLIFGLGLQGGGVGDTLWLIKHGATVHLTDQHSRCELESSLSRLPKDIKGTYGKHSVSDINWAEVIIKNPGVSDQHPLIQLAHRQKKPVYTSIALVVREARDRIIGITGTRGKSTTTQLIYQLLRSAYPGEIVVGGNIPQTSGLSLLDELSSARYLVLELSSFQLHNFHDLKLSPRYAVLTNLYPDHLNRYSSIKEYQQDKTAIFAYQNSSDFTFVCRDNREAFKLAHFSPGHVIPFSKQEVPRSWPLKLLGEHNRENIAAMLAVAKLLKLDFSLAKKTAISFSPLPFRLELIVQHNGISYYNDTTSTTPTATQKALAALTDPTVLILGGANKFLPTAALVSTLARATHIRSLVLLGSKDLPKFVKQLRKTCPDKFATQVFSMSAAVKEATKLASPGWNVLLSPGFASFDLFKNEFDRGRQFNEAVRRIH